MSAAVVAGRDGSDPTEVDCDLLLVSGGWNPAVHLFSQARGPPAVRRGLGAFLPAEPCPV